VTNYLTTTVKFNLSGWTRKTDAHVPQQKGFIDCGVFMCQYLKWLVNNMAIPAIVERVDSDMFRNMMVMELVSGNLRFADSTDDIELIESV
jgi:Ulp1 family protease